jgi:hypothetical protein
LLSLCDPGGSPGPDGIHPRILKECAKVLALPYSILFKSSFSSGLLPPAWKEAVIHPVFKGGNRHDPNNYRPISLTCIPCKLMEKCVNKSMLSHLLSNNLIHQSQHGFLPSRSCFSNLSIFLSHLTESAEIKQPVECIFFDFSKAFDKIPHTLLVDRWESLGLSGPLSRWLSNFLDDRRSTVRVAGAISHPFSITSGVPQGSVLGPSLFTIFINPLPSVLPPRTQCLLYADDLKIWSKHPDSLQAAINSCCSWSLSNLLPFNPHKIVHVSFLNPNPPTFILNASTGPIEIPMVSHHKDLGLWISSDLSPSLMCRQTAKKAARTLNYFRRSFSHLDRSNFLTLYSLFVRPHLEYCSSLWLPWLKKDEVLLENVQRRATKSIPSLRRLPYPTRLTTLDLFPLKYRRIRGCLLLTYKLFKLGLHTQFFSLSHNTNLRGHSLKLFHKRNTSRARRNFSLPLLFPTGTAFLYSVFKKAIDTSFPRSICL